MTDDDLARLGQEVEASLRAAGQSEVNTEDVGRAILEPLSQLDAVAYLRFASVYNHYSSVEDFERAIEALREPSTP